MNRHSRPAGLRRAAWAALGALAVAGTASAGPLEVQVLDAGGRPLAGAVVFPQSPEARAAVRPAAGVEIAQVDKRFVPEVSVVPLGTPVDFPNRDSVRHHVYSFSPAKKFEIKLYVGSPAAPVVFDQPGVAVLGCNIHDQMAAWVVVVDTPWHARTDSQGRASWPQLPTGRYRLRTWHVGLPVGEPPADQPLQLGAAATRVTVGLAGVRP